MLGELISRALPAFPKRLVGRVAGRYIAGETRVEALSLAAVLAEQGFVTTLDVLGEDAGTAEQATRAADEYRALIADLASRGLPRAVSLKLSALGLGIDPALAEAELARVLAQARRHGAFVRIDMEGSSTTDQTLAIYERARDRFPGLVGTVLQARLRRTGDDARRLARPGESFRLCKGIYAEPEEIAYQDADEIRDAYREVLGTLLDGGSRVAVATHDVELIAAAEAELARREPPPAGAEFQALLGVPVEDELERLRDAGHTVRLYLPYGDEWYAYSVRRLRESPELASAILKTLFRPSRLRDKGRGVIH